VKNNLTNLLVDVMNKHEQVVKLREQYLQVKKKRIIKIININRCEKNAQ